MVKIAQRNLEVILRDVRLAANKNDFDTKCGFKNEWFWYNHVFVKSNYSIAIFENEMIYEIKS